MTSPETALARRVGDAIAQAFGEEYAGTDPVVRPSAQSQFGDYQANGAMGLAKRLGLKSREVADKILVHLDVADICSSADVAGPGFINLRLSDGWVTTALAAVAGDERLGAATVSDPKRVVMP